MFFWYAGLTLLLVAWIFSSPNLDYRLVMLGSVLPVGEKIIGEPWVLHMLLAPVIGMALVMVAFSGRRLAQRRWLGVPIGLFFFLVLDGTWTRTRLFWWPAFGVSIGDEPSWRPVPVLLVMELVGIAALVITARRCRLDEPANRQRFLATGQLPR